MQKKRLDKLDLTNDSSSLNHEKEFLYKSWEMMDIDE